MKTNPLIKRYGKEKRWVNFRIEERKGKKTKVPYSPHTKRMASSTDAATWGTYEEAFKVSPNVGICFSSDKLLLGIDIDHCLKKGTNQIIHEQKEQIAQLIIEANTYTEISPSGEGLHLYFTLKDALSLESNKQAPYELYTEGRYFTFTAHAYKEQKSVRSISSVSALKLLRLIGYPFKGSGGNIPGDKGEAVHKGDEQTSAQPTFTDEDVIRRMFLSRNGKKIKELYEGSLTEYENDASRGDMALLSYFAFWTRKNFEQMKRLWISSPLGKREKTQQRPDYQNRSINAAIVGCTAVYETPQMRMETEHPGLKLLFRIVGKGDIEYLLNTENMYRILRDHEEFRGRLRFDAFKQKYEILDEKEGLWRTFEESDTINILTKISIEFTEWFGKVGKDMVYDAVVKISKENGIDSARDYIEALRWDQVPRLNEWLHHTYGAPINEYHTAVASNWVKGLVRRICLPGSKFDYVLVLEGPQGSKKSTSLSVLGGDWHVESAMSTESKDFFMQFQGKAIIEFSEGETLSRTEVKRMKALITTQVDTYRPPYERTSQDFPRRCVFAMTTNQEEYLKDETGNRRWLPVKLTKEEADVKWLAENRDQLLAEAYHRVFNLHETLYEFPREATEHEQELRRISDPSESLVIEWYMKEVDDEDQKNGITTQRVYVQALHKNMPGARPMNKFEEMSIATILTKKLGLVKRPKMLSGVRGYFYCNEKDPLRDPNDTPMAKLYRDFEKEEI